MATEDLPEDDICDCGLQVVTFLCFKMIINCASQAALAGPLAASILNLQDEDILMPADVSLYIYHINNMAEC